ncbi:MAG: imidazole glycerol phosphate synthase subunit HisH [Bacteroidetes bacterium]|nr:imidazole glycerol phosphate synthase subunit HisH [Bacteroidota bacterium]
MLVILDYGIGNLTSIKNMLKRAGFDSRLSTDTEEVASAEKLILPGVGHFDYCMTQLRKAPFWDMLHKRVLEDKVPILGVCVGCQMLMESSEEGREAGLGWLKGKVVRFNKGRIGDLKIPHMSWTDVEPAPGHPLYEGIEEPRFYFVHSYHVQAENPQQVTGTAEYGYRFTASVQKENIQGVQFHPEKSHRSGMRLYTNFIKNY